MQMVGRVSERELQSIGLGYQQTNIRVRPVLRRNVLEQYHETLEILLQQQPLTPVQKERGTDVQLEYREAIRLGQIGVPESYRTRERYLSG